MDRLLKHRERLWWSLTLALVIVLMPSEKAGAQMMGFGMGYGNPGMMGYGNPGMMGYGNPGMMGYGNPGMMGYGNPGMMGYRYRPFRSRLYNAGYLNPGFGYGYPGFGYGYGYPGMGFAPGYAGFYGTGYRNPLFGVGLTPLGTQSYMMETRLLGRVPRVSTGYYRSAYNRPIVYRGW
jgi:hypothetical protein